MARMTFNPTRMELTKLKKRLVTARRGHKLLKDKRDELMRQFMEAISENKRLRIALENKIRSANRHMSLARSMVRDEIIATSLLFPKQSMSLTVEEKNIMSVRVPQFTAQFRSSDPGDIYSYGFAFTNAELDDTIQSISDIMPDIIRLAELEKSCQLMASEIEKTRRRVNALEHVMIPRYQDAIRFITMKLDESERSAITRLMKVKDMMIEKAINDRRKRDES